MIRVRIFNNQYLSVFSADIKSTQNEAGTFTVEVAKADLSVEPEDLFLEAISLYFNSQLLISGIVDSFEKVKQDDTILIKLNCLDEVGRLTTIRAKSDAHYQDQLLTFIVSDLLSSTADWQIGDTSTMVDSSITTTIDLRNKEFLWAQLVEVVKACPDVFIRYGGYSTVLGKHLLDMGEFNNNSGIRLVEGQNLTSLEYESSFVRPYYEIEAYGGRSGSERATLQDALDHDPTLSTHPDFPIVTSGGKLVVRDNAVTRGLTAVKEYSANKTKNDLIPEDAQRKEAGYALWQSVVSDMKKSSVGGKYKVECVEQPFDNFQPYVVSVGDRVYVAADVKERVLQIATGLPSWETLLSIQQMLRVISYTLNFSGEILTYQFELSTGNYADTSDASQQIYSSLDSNQNADTGRGILPVNIETSVVSHGTGVAADSTFGGFASKTFTIPFPSGPASNSVAYTISISPTNYLYEVQAPAPAPPATPLTIYARPNGAAWTVASQATITVTWITS